MSLTHAQTCPYILTRTHTDACSYDIHTHHFSIPCSSHNVSVDATDIREINNWRKLWEFGRKSVICSICAWYFYFPFIYFCLFFLLLLPFWFYSYFAQFILQRSYVGDCGRTHAHSMWGVLTQTKRKWNRNGKG